MNFNGKLTMGISKQEISVRERRNMINERKDCKKEYLESEVKEIYVW